MNFPHHHRSLLAVLLAATACSSFGAFAQAAPVVTHDLAAEFSIASNPNGVWIYGMVDVLKDGYTLTPLDRSRVDQDAYVWDNASHANIWLNGRGRTIYGVPPNQVSLHPGFRSGMESAVVRFTAQVDSVVSFDGWFGPGDMGSTSGAIVLNRRWSSPLFASEDISEEKPFDFKDLALNAGDTLDFLVGNNGSPSSDNTELRLSLAVSAVPEPHHGWLMLAGLMPLASIVARRRVNTNQHAVDTQ